MNYKLVVRDEAERDVEVAYHWYQSKQTDLGKEFMVDVRSTMDIIVKSPLLFASDRLGVRVANTDRFPYLIYFRTRDSLIEILAIVHSARHPQTWQSRL
jgi:toxin ParE1/3/4